MGRFLLKAFVFVFSLIISFTGGFIAYVSLGLPSVDTLKKYHPKVSTEIYSADMVKIGEFSKERRFFVPLKDIPEKVRLAFISAEDGEFYTHRGVSFTGILRAMLKNMIAGKVKQGGSTITEQTAKVLLLSPERTMMRRARSVLLALKMERNLTKDEILEIYLNEIYLGEGSYGVGAAAETYFGKSVKSIDIGEAAVLAALPRAPSRDNPRVSLVKAKDARNHVLQRMREENAITKEELEKYKALPVTIAETSNINQRYSPYFVEHVRRYLMNKYGEKAVLEDGLHVITSVDIQAAKASDKALREGIEEVDRHQGYRGPIENVSADKFEGTLADLKNKNSPLWNPGGVYKALVTKIEDDKKIATLNAGSHKGTIAFEDTKWARKPNPQTYWEYAQIKKISEALKVGDVIWAKAKAENGKFMLFQEPQVQGALIALSPQTGAIKAMVGGYDFEKSEFNRAVQAKRQPGSSFKPLVFAAGIASQKFTAGSMISDSPLIFEDVGNDSVWKPKNYEGKFQGDLILRDCLVESRNTPSIRILQEVGVQSAIEFARNMGIESELKPELSLALGASVVSPIEMARAFGIFANHGKKNENEFFILKITDREGNILERNSYQDPSLNLVEQTLAAQDQVKEETVKPDDPLQVLTPQVAYIMTHLLQQVITSGTGEKARLLNRPAAGKTGTTDENKDAWFIGFTPDLVAVVWIGYDDSNKSLGVKEDGGKIASPIWTNFMRDALAGQSVKDFKVPEGVVIVNIDKRTGLLAGPKTTRPLTEVFIEGTEPTEISDQTGSNRKNSEDFFKGE